MVECVSVGVRYRLGTRRDDIKSLAHRALVRRPGRKEVWALRGLDLTARPGEVLGVIGRNGAGKTTLCRVLAGLLRPDEGRVRVRGKVAALLTFGTGFRLELTGRENIHLNGMMLGMSRRRIEERFDEIVGFAGVGRFLDQPLKKYSTGMRARLGFAVAACLDPDVLLVDEALSVGDREFVQRAGERIREIIRGSKLAVVVSHGLSFVREVCTRAVWLEGGRVEAHGLPADVVAAYRARYPAPPAAAPRKRITAHLVPTGVASCERAVVTVRDLGIRYKLRRRGGFWALRGVGFDVHEGDILGIVGPNGAGKTTLARVLTGILRPDRGTATVRGEVTALLTFGTGFHPQLSGRDNVLRNGMLLGLPKARILSAYPRIVEFAGIGRFMDEPVKTYSAGMRSRLGFSIAAHLEPDVFVIDEAMNAGDAEFFVRAAAKLQELIAAARCVIVITHNLVFVQTVCTCALWLERGRIRFQGAPGEVVARYRAAIRGGRPAPAERTPS